MKNYKHIKDIVTKELSCSAHNMDHVMRVFNLCKLIADSEANVDRDVLFISALLHDIARVKESKDNTGNVDHAVLGSEMAEEILKALNYDDKMIEKVKHCIVSHRFRSGHIPKTIEAKILFDADKLDAIGAIGIARCFMLAGQFKQKINIQEPIEEYIEKNVVENGRLKDVSKHSPIVEYELKFKKIPSRMFTNKGREIAVKRLSYMEDFFSKLKNESNGLE